MKAKQILFTAPNIAQLVDADVPEPAEHEVLIETEYSAISAGTEYSNLIGEKNITADISKCVSVFPRALGYSSCGIVKKIGSKVKTVQVGERVVAYFGKHRSLNVLPDTQVLRVPDGTLTPQEAALSVIMSFPGEAVHKCRLEFGESAMVMGLGILGLGAVQLCRIAGAAPVIAADPDPSKYELAKKLGADVVLNPLAEDFQQQIREVTHGQGVNVIIEGSGRPSALHSSLKAASLMGRVCLMGCIRNPVDQVDFYHDVHHKGVCIIGANDYVRPHVESAPGNWTWRDEISALMRFRKYGRFTFDGLISRVVSPELAGKIYEELAYHPGTFPIGTLFDWNLIR